MPGGSALPGTPCDDGNTFSVNDSWDNNCNCIGTVGIEQVEADAIAIRAFPDPVRDLLTITIATTHGAQTSIILRDVVGQVVFAKELCIVSGERKEVIDMSALARGVYTVEVLHGAASSVKRITKY